MRNVIDRAESGRRIGELIKSKNINRKLISDVLGVTEATVSSWTLGKSFPNLHKLYTLSGILGVPIDDMIVPNGSGLHPAK